MLPFSFLRSGSAGTPILSPPLLVEHVCNEIDIHAHEHIFLIAFTSGQSALGASPDCPGRFLLSFCSCAVCFRMKSRTAFRLRLVSCVGTTSKAGCCVFAALGPA